MGTYLATVLRLAILAVLSVVALGLARVLIELSLELRRKQRLASTRGIQTLSPLEFEQYVAMLFEEAGYQVRHSGGSGDRGVDLTVSRGGTAGIVQCKRYEDAVGPGTVRELIGAMTNAGVREGYLVTTSTFTAGAESEARKAPYEVNLVDGEKLARWARAYGFPGTLMDDK